ncbi:MAG: hypothetical protein AAFY60_13625, partial [Myxococcota bacterium]
INFPSFSNQDFNHCVRFNTQQGFYVDAQCRANFGHQSTDGRQAARPSTAPVANQGLSLPAPRK